MSLERAWNKYGKITAIVLLWTFLLSGCSVENKSLQYSKEKSVEIPISQYDNFDSDIKLDEKLGQTEKDSIEERKKTLRLYVNNEEVIVSWENNESVDGLKELVKTQPLAIQMSMYGGFEQVGSIGKSITRNDRQTITKAGDIVLYSGNQIVIFYGSNSWTYTRLGKIQDKSVSELAQLLGNGDVTITFKLD